MTTYKIDARRLFCPMPVIKAQDAISQLQNKERLEVVATDRGVLHDIPAWCRINGHDIEQILEENGEISISIRVNKE
ncbi:MAG: sulfurtransferase TusA family protein [Gammaproteobacteria bacterium]|nr:sulfurtransferase TusA family protein [Gammaproteobacteria bacterium]